MSPGLALQNAMRSAMLARSPLMALLGGARIHDELPRGAHPPYVAFAAIETRDWSVADQKAHEHFVTIDVVTNMRNRDLAQNISNEVEAALDNVALNLTGHNLVNLRVVSALVMRAKATENYGASLRFRAVTEPI